MNPYEPHPIIPSFAIITVIITRLSPGSWIVPLATFLLVLTRRSELVQIIITSLYQRDNAERIAHLFLYSLFMLTTISRLKTTLSVFF